MKIYTKGGDKGETGLFGGSRVPKNHARIEAYGTLDELNAALGVTLSSGKLDKTVVKSLRQVQNELFQLGAELATPPGKKVSTQLIHESQIERLEKEIDQMESKMEPLKQFILPGGSMASAEMHLARTICRRAERAIVTLGKSEEVRELVIQYVNRLSDHLFVTARYLNHLEGIADVPWNAP